MADATIQRPRLLELADRLERDIRSRRLKVGDAYLTTTEAARMLQVNGNLANRALQLLVQRGRLERRQRRGSYIAESRKNARTSPLARVHLVVHQHYLKAEGMLADGTIVGMQQELPGIEVQVDFLPANQCGEYIDQLISAALRNAKPEGFVLVRAPFEVHQRMHASGLPVVVHGSVYPALPQLPAIDVDHRLKGKLLVEYLLGRGYRRFGLLLRERLLPGDHILLDAAMHTMGQGRVSPKCIHVRSLANDRLLIAATARELLDQSDEPLGLICRSQPIAEAALSALTTPALRKRCEVTVCDLYSTMLRPALPFAYTRTEATAIEVGGHIGRLLAQQSRQGNSAGLKQEVLSAVLEMPDCS